MEKVKEMRLYSVFLSLLIPCCLFFSSCHKQYTEEDAPVRYEFGLPIDSFRVDTGYVKSGETLGGIMSRLGADRKQQTQIATLSSDVFDVRKLRPGKTYYGLYQPDSTGVERLCYWIYVASVREATVLDMRDKIHAEKHEKPIIYKLRQADAVIESSLWNAMTKNDLPVELALELSDIYAWTIDFFGLQKGDSIRVLFDEVYVDTLRTGIGQIYACNFYHGRQWQQAYYFEAGELHTYFDENGKSLRKAFLKAPLNYKRISSRFSYARKHPVFKIVRPHTGVDYAAPTGTPVSSIGDGIVIEKGYKGQAGNMVKIKHNSTYTTAYLHLSKYGDGIKQGTRVRQGQVIGYVGATGAATGPHLDFRVWKNGTPVDPLKMESPPADPVPAKYMPEFKHWVDSIGPQIW